MIQLPESIKDRLKSNWGDRMHAMACYAEVRLFEELHDNGFYLLAMNPEDEDQVFVLREYWKCPMPEIESFRDVCAVYAIEGEEVSIDPEFRRMWASELFKRLGGNL